MALKNIIFKRPVRIEDKIYHASKRSVEIDEKHLKGKLMQSLLDSGEIAVIAQPAEKPDEESAPAPKSGKSAK